MQKKLMIIAIGSIDIMGIILKGILMIILMVRFIHAEPSMNALIIPFS